jgi:6-pyruvoyltetrahydropterin/6-carboxytetrahydropterin synthase
MSLHQVVKVYDHNLGLSTCFRQWKADSHCAQIHGYALSFAYTFECDSDHLDERGWVVDFGNLDGLKQALRYWFDHTLVVAMDDPFASTFQVLAEDGIANVRMMFRVGCEAFAMFACELAQKELVEMGLEERVRVAQVVVSEHGGNHAVYVP